VSLLNPVGAVIQAIITVYNTIAFFVERIKQIAALVEAIVDSIANIAAGKLDAAANYVERTLGRTVPVILGFLARFIGLGDVSGAIKKVIETIQLKVDAAIDRAIAWLIEKAKALFGKGDEDPRWAAAVAGVSADVDALKEEERSEAGITKLIPGWKTKYQFTELAVKREGGELVIEGAMSPGRKVKSVKDDATIVAELKGEEWIQIKRGKGWLVAELDSVDEKAREIKWTEDFPVSGTVKGTTAFKEYGTLVRKYIPGTEPYFAPEKLKEENAKDDWGDSFPTAKKVLNYRANDDDDQSHVPEGKNWHHIHEQSGEGPNSVVNLVLTSASNNSTFNVWFTQRQLGVNRPGDPDIGYLEGTGPKTLRTYLKDKGNPDLWKRWGYACLALHKVSVQPGTPAAKGKWNAIPKEAS
jgi:hypothetical protein